MTILDWTIIVGLNGAIVTYGIISSRHTKTSSDWFLGGRSLPWWIVGLSMWATAIDSSDYVAESGGTFNFGMQYFVINWVGTVVGWVVAANFVVPPMYRAGMYTNAEYLEARYGPTARIISALIQVQYRTLVLGFIATTMYLTLSVVCGWPPAAIWCTVVGVAALATVYTALGGLKSVAMTDALQSVTMVAASLVLFVLVWNRAEGWEGIERRLNDHEAGLAQQMLHVGHDHFDTEDVSDASPQMIERKLLTGGAYEPDRQQIVRRTPAWLGCIGFFLIGMSYSIVNHTQSIRLFGSRSEWDLRMSAVLASSILIVTSFTTLMIGVMGRALYPTLPPDVAHHGTNDVIYPLIVRESAGVGLLGLVLAGLFAASFSTYDSIGSTLSSLLVRDVYARLLVRDEDDRHYLRVGQLLTPVIIFGSFGYIPMLLKSGMANTYIDLLSTFVAPLLTIYLMGVFTRVHRRSGALGLAAGVAYGVLRMLAPGIAENYGIAVLPPVMAGSLGGWLFGAVVTAAAMLLVSLVFGWEPARELLHEESGGWLRASQLQIRAIDQTHHMQRSNMWPIGLSLLVVLVGAVLSFVVFW